MMPKKLVKVTIERESGEIEIRQMTTSTLHAFIGIFHKDAKIVSVKLTKEHSLSSMRIKQ